MTKLGVNIDHIATLREARGEWYPDPFESLKILKRCHVAQVTLHLREDRRHIQDHDLERIADSGILPVNLEMAITREMLQTAARLPVHTCTFVPEKRLEVTTEGGLDVVGQERRVTLAVEGLKKSGRRVSLFIDPVERQIEAAWRTGADAVEFHTGTYCQLYEKYFTTKKTYRLDRQNPLAKKIFAQIQNLTLCTKLARSRGLLTFAGHGLHAKNLAPVAKIAGIEEYNIGHAIVARAIFVGLEASVNEIQRVLKGQ